MFRSGETRSQGWGRGEGEWGLTQNHGELTPRAPVPSQTWQQQAPRGWMARSSRHGLRPYLFVRRGAFRIVPTSWTYVGMLKSLKGESCYDRKCFYFNRACRRCACSHGFCGSTSGEGRLVSPRGGPDEVPGQHPFRRRARHMPAGWKFGRVSAVAVNPREKSIVPPGRRPIPSWSSTRANTSAAGEGHVRQPARHANRPQATCGSPTTATTR